MSIQKFSVSALALVADQTLTAFIGPSECGKSTFLRCLNRMNETIDMCRVTGQIEMDGQDINHKSIDPIQLRAPVGMVFQKPNPFPKSIYDNIAYGPRIHGLAKSKTELDEPGSALDPIATAQVEELIDGLRREYLVGMHLHFVDKNIERAGDHATGILEQTIYLITGELPEEDRPKEDVSSLALPERNG